MEPVDFPAANLSLGPPDDFKGECVPLRVEKTERGYSSHWKPSPEELAILNAGGNVRLNVHSNAHPPVWIDTVKGE